MVAQMASVSQTVSESLLHIPNPLTLLSHSPSTLHAKAADYFYLRDTEQSISTDTAVIEMTSTTASLICFTNLIHAASV